MAASDETWMGRALMLGRRAMGRSGDNPAVGCVIVKDGFPVGLGWTGEGGRPHAEPLALAMAGDQARGATAYVSLEPCAHHGRTPPCAEALVKAGLARVVTTIEDPDRRVAGRGHAILRAAGITVETGVLADAARRDLAGFLSRITRHRPHVFLKLAMSRDGMIAAERGKPTAITGGLAGARVHLMRAEADAIMVGVSTVLADDPLLTCRLPGMQQRSPIRVVSDSRLSTPLSSRLIATAGEVPVWVLTTADAEKAKADALTAAGATIIACNRHRRRQGRSRRWHGATGGARHQPPHGGRRRPHGPCPHRGGPGGRGGLPHRAERPGSGRAAGARRPRPRGGDGITSVSRWWMRKSLGPTR